MIDFIEGVLYALLDGIAIIFAIPLIALGIIMLPIIILFYIFVDIFSKNNY